jgi:hypothetical protein
MTRRPVTRLRRRPDSYIEHQPDEPLRRRPDPGSEPDDDGLDRYSDGDCGLNWPAKKGNTNHRGKGVPNKFTRVMKEASIIAAETCGLSDDGSLTGYLRYVARRYPATYTRSILSKLIPFTLKAELTAKLKSVAEIRADLEARGIPLPPSLFEIPITIAQAREFNRRDRDRDEDTLQREPEPPPEPSRFDNPYSIHFRPQPDTPGPPVLGEQFEMPWPSRTSDADLHCWPEGRPPRLVINNNEEHPDDNTIPPPAAATAE